MSPFPIGPWAASASVATLVLLLTLWAVEDDVNPFQSVRLIVGSAVLMSALAAWVVPAFLSGRSLPTWSSLVVAILGVKVVRGCSWGHGCWLVACTVSLAMSLAALLAVIVALLSFFAPFVMDRIDQSISFVQQWWGWLVER